MALLIGISELERCGCCGSVEHSRQRVYRAYCYAGEEWLLEPDPSDPEGRPHLETGTHLVGHAVEVESLERRGWGLRGGRLPICPEHREAKDEEDPWRPG